MNMDELISRNELIEEFEWLKSQVSESSKDEIEEVIQRIKNAQTVLTKEEYEKLFEYKYMYEDLCK